MPKPPQVALFWRERGEAFLARARAHATQTHDGAQVVERSVRHFANDVEPFAAVYVEAQFSSVVDAYRALGVPVFTEREMTHEEDGEGERRQAEGCEAPEGDRTQEEVIQLATRRRRRSA